MGPSRKDLPESQSLELGGLRASFEEVHSQVKEDINVLVLQQKRRGPDPVSGDRTVFRLKRRVEEQICVVESKLNSLWEAQASFGLPGPLRGKAPRGIK